MLTAVLTFSTPAQAMQMYKFLTGVQREYPERILEVEVNFELVEVLLTATKEVVEAVIGQTREVTQA